MYVSISSNNGQINAEHLVSSNKTEKACWETIFGNVSCDFQTLTAPCIFYLIKHVIVFYFL